MSAWKACDLRGPVPAEVHPDLFRRIGAAAGGMLAAGSSALVAGDFRLSTPGLKAALTAGLVEAGIRVLDAGQVPTPVAYFGGRALGAAAVFIVTASHNPPDHNGLKLNLGLLPPTEADLEALRAAAEAHTRSARPQGSIEPVDVLPRYLQWILGRWRHLKRMPPLRVVLDAGNGAWSEIGPQVFSELGFDVHPLFCRIDGGFPSRPPDSARPGNLAELCRRAPGVGAGLGIAWDGDGDRVGFVDETGAYLPADTAAVLLARPLLEEHRGSRVVYDLKLSSVFARTVAALGGVPIMERSGHAFLKRRMIQDDCLFGCEISGHYFYRELGGGDDGLYTALRMAELVAREGPLSRLRMTVPPAFITPDLRLPDARLPFAEIAARLAAALPGAAPTTLDGLRLEAREGVLLVRRSVTEPAVTLRVEGVSRQALDQLLSLVLTALPELAGDIRTQLTID